jgi:DNA primase
VRFQVQRALDTADLSGAEGKDRVIDELRPVFAGLAPSVMRQELLGLVASRLDLADALVAELLAKPGVAPRAPVPAAPAAANPANGGPARVVSRGERIERTFLALCIALPGPGHEALDRVTPEHFSSELLRRAADHLRMHLAAPAEGVADDDAELAALITELSVRAARGNPPRETLRVEELQLDLARLDRAVAQARSGADGHVAELAVTRAAVKAQLDVAIDAALEASSSPG